MTAPKPAIAILGPTASGKTKLGVTISQAYGGEVISLDSLQCYEPGSILTAKPLLEEMQNITHHLIGYLQAQQEPNNFVELVASTMSEINARHKLPVLVGGSTSLTIPSLRKAYKDNYQLFTIILMPHELTYCSLVRNRSLALMEQGLLKDLDDLYNMEKDLLNSRPAFDRGVWKAIGYREFYPYLERRAEAPETRQRLLDDALASFISNTERYGLQQMVWIREHLLPQLLEIHSVCVPLSVGDKFTWRCNVQEPAMVLVNGYLRLWDSSG